MPMLIAKAMPDSLRKVKKLAMAGVDMDAIMDRNFEVLKK